MILYIAIAILVLALFFIFRDLMCWYFKINERLDVEKKILKELRKLNKANKDDREINKEEKVE